jgi:hypothetical protein
MPGESPSLKFLEGKTSHLTAEGWLAALITHMCDSLEEMQALIPPREDG